jgi:bifunctional DNA-binding transcriptional regulator/antitoxin component of YhaV-PrlF toxin-antitoxin module
MSYILEVQEDEDGNQFIVLPEEVLENLDWHEGDVLDWKLKGEGIIISKINDPAGYIALEE